MLSPARSRRAARLSPDDILSPHSPAVRGLATVLRGFIRETVPEAEERAYPGWRAIGYRHPEVGYFCGLFPLPDRVDLAFEFGVLLPDPHHILDGEGKQVRYVRIRAEEDIPADALRGLLLSAIDLPTDHQTRLALVRAAAKPTKVIRPLLLFNQAA